MASTEQRFSNKKIENLLGPPNGCFSVSESMSVTYLQTDRVNTRGPGGPKNPENYFHNKIIKTIRFD